MSHDVQRQKSHVKGHIFHDPIYTKDTNRQTQGDRVYTWWFPGVERRQKNEEQQVTGTGIFLWLLFGC